MKNMLYHKFEGFFAEETENSYEWNTKVVRRNCKKDGTKVERNKVSSEIKH